METKKGKSNESKFMFYGLIVLCIVLGFLSYQNKKKRNQLEEIKKLPFHNVTLESVDDGTYTGETATSFLYVVADVEVQNHQLKDIKIEKMNGKGAEHLEKIAQRMVEANSTKVSVQKHQEYETLILMSCVDSALYGVESNQEEILTNAEN